MPPGKTHELINISLLIPVTFYLGHLFWNNEQGMLFSAAFILNWVIHTFYITPDLDTDSRPRRRLWIFGWILDKLFTHRGISHSFIAWSILFLIEYVFIGWIAVGGYIPIITHLIADRV